VHTALKHGLKAILCIGESLEEREANKTEEVLLRQASRALKGVTPEQAETMVIAYEPVWAIGTGKTATPEMAGEAHFLIRSELARLLGRATADSMRILYGGSVKPDNAPALLNQPEIDGALVGGASLDPHSFAKIVNY
jgi:triosephosphate isomerase